MSKNVAGVGITDPNEFFQAAAATATSFSPFDALGIQPRVLNHDQLNSAFRRAHAHLFRAATAPAFPQTAQINAARDYLATLTGLAATSGRWAAVIARWVETPRTFFAELPFGDAGAFTTATPTPLADPPHATAANANPPSGQDAHDPFVVSDDDDGEPAAPPSFSPMPPMPPAGATPRRPRAMPANPATPARPNQAGGDANAAATPTSNRSAGGSRRNARVATVNTDNHVIVGTWRLSPNLATPHAVTAAFDRRGRLNYRIIARDIHGNTLAAPTATAVSARAIQFMPPYNGLSANEIRELLDQQLNQRRLG